MRKIKKVKTLGQYRLNLVFDEGLQGTVDLSDLVGKGVFAVWLDHGVFEQVEIGSSGELVWSDQVDLCPDAPVPESNREEVGGCFPRIARRGDSCLRLAASSA